MALHAHNLASYSATVAAARPAQAQLQAQVRDALVNSITRYGGILVHARPDSAVALFADESESRPDHAARALSAALAAVRAVDSVARSGRNAAAGPGPGKALTITAGVHLGAVQIKGKGGVPGAVRAGGEALEVARMLEGTARDLRWSIVASAAARRAAGAGIVFGRVGSVTLPDQSFMEIAEVSGLSRAQGGGAGTEERDLREAVERNGKLLARPRDATGTGAAGAPASSLLAIDGYRIVRKVGEGGMASIFLAEALPGGEQQILKVMRMDATRGAEALHRFMQEFALLAQIRHPNVAKIHRQGFTPGHSYIAMEYFPAGDLRARIRAGMTGPEVFACVKQIAAALDAIHRAGIVHRDLKPDNLMLRADGSIALADFGIAKHVSLLLTDTAHGDVVGTPYYLSPEQAAGQPVDRRCDLYSLGVILFEMLTGQKPYRAESAEAILQLHISAPVPVVAPPYDALQPIVDRLMAKNRDARYSGAREFLGALALLGV